MRSRGFEIVSRWEGQGIRLPERKTADSAGYDIESAEDAELLPGKVTILSTGLKAYMGSGEYLAIHIRSSMGIRHGLMLANGTGIIDRDYYNNEDNEGHILIAVYNASEVPFHVSKGDRIAQGIFGRFLPADGDRAEGTRRGGVGSTGVS